MTHGARRGPLLSFPLRALLLPLSAITATNVFLPWGAGMHSIDSTDTALRLAIVRRAFSVRRRGYDTGEVDELLDTVSKLADELLAEVEGTSRHLAEAEAELVGTRAEVRELHEVQAATERLLATTRAELRGERHPNTQDSEAEEKLVVAEAELRLLRASAEHTERALNEARELLGLEQAARGTVEVQLADMTAELHAVTAQLAGLIGEQARDPFAEVGDEVAALLRAAAASAEDVRERARRQTDALIAEAQALADALLDEAEAKMAEAEARAGSGGVLEQAGEALDRHEPFAMETNGHDRHEPFAMEAFGDGD
ncbi:MAG: DivIVA domain-containing protein [Acidimicrobiales bacterium]